MIPAGVKGAASEMRQKELEILLSSGFRGFSKPRPELEQWATPGNVAATMIFLARQDIEGKTVCDLGAGTGILSAGCFLVGAGHVISVEIDPLACGIMRENFEMFGISAEIVNSDISGFSEAGIDVVLMNPPFGAQFASRHSDREFLAKAFSLNAPVVYSLHLTETRNFIRGFSESSGFRDSVLGTFQFPLPASFEFHRKPRKTAEVDYHKIWK
ncbi:MAG: METTL5 family protein [archaeon]